jgi:hypothetical protein
VRRGSRGQHKLEQRALTDEVVIALPTTAAANVPV